MDNRAKAVIYYLFHSGFAVEYKDYLLIFDYYRMPDNAALDGLAEKELINKIVEAKHVFVFVSHSHYDHFNPKVFDWKRYNSSLTYILSSDVKDAFSQAEKEAACLYLSPGDFIEKNGILVRAYGSTDLGVSFLVETGDLSIFHAGDLNWWHWADESTEQELMEEEKKFKDEVKKIEGKKIDVMFFPVDPGWVNTTGLEVHTCWRNSGRPCLCPCIWENNYITERFADKMMHLGVPVLKIEHQGKDMNLLYQAKTDNKGGIRMKFTFSHNNLNVLDLEKAWILQKALGLLEVRRKEAS